MRNSKLEINGGRKYLVCWYDTERCNWNGIINRALERHKLKPGECPVLCLAAKKEVQNGVSVLQ